MNFRSTVISIKFLTNYTGDIETVCVKFSVIIEMPKNVFGAYPLENYVKIN